MRSLYSFLSLAILLVTSNANAACRSYEAVEARVFSELHRSAEEADKTNGVRTVALKPIGDQHRAGTQLCEHRFFVNFLLVSAGKKAPEGALLSYVAFATWDDAGFRMTLVLDSEIPR